MIPDFNMWQMTCPIPQIGDRSEGLTMKYTPQTKTDAEATHHHRDINYIPLARLNPSQAD